MIIRLTVDGGSSAKVLIDEGPMNYAVESGRFSCRGAYIATELVSFIEAVLKLEDKNDENE